jgi:hypothetical protein
MKTRQPKTESPSLRAYQRQHRCSDALCGCRGSSRLGSDAGRQGYSTRRHRGARYATTTARMVFEKGPALGYRLHALDPSRRDNNAWGCPMFGLSETQTLWLFLAIGFIVLGYQINKLIAALRGPGRQLAEYGAVQLNFGDAIGEE